MSQVKRETVGASVRPEFEKTADRKMKDRNVREESRSRIHGSAERSPAGLNSEWVCFTQTVLVQPIKADNQF